MAPTVVNISSGGRTRASGLFSGAFVVATFLLLSRAVAWLPLPALAGMLIVLAGRMFDWRGFRLLRQRATWFDFAVAAVVVATAVFVDLVLASGVGLALSILLFIRNMMNSSVVRRKVYGGEVTSHQRRLPEEAEILAREGSKIAVFELQGSLFFGTADQLYTEVEPDFSRRRYFIFDMRRVLSVDFTAAHMLDMIENRLFERGGRLLFANIPQTSPTGQDLSSYLHQLGLTDPKRRAHLFPTLDEAFTWAEDRLLSKNKAGAAPDSPLALEEIGLLKGLEPAHLAALQDCASARTLAAGERLFKQGDETADEMYLIRSGRVRIELDVASGEHRLIAVFARGDFFGEMAFVDRGRRAASASALIATELFALSRRRFDAAAARDPELGRKLFSRISKALALRLRQADAEIRALHEA
jgi:SulP family sulfate permease